jgi:phage-related protein
VKVAVGVGVCMALWEAQYRRGRSEASRIVSLLIPWIGVRAELWQAPKTVSRLCLVQTWVAVGKAERRVQLWSCVIEKTAAVSAQKCWSRGSGW